MTGQVTAESAAPSNWNSWVFEEFFMTTSHSRSAGHDIRGHEQPGVLARFASWLVPGWSVSKSGAASPMNPPQGSGASDRYGTGQRVMRHYTDRRHAPVASRTNRVSSPTEQKCTSCQRAFSDARYRTARRLRRLSTSSSSP